jgi:hypothetical protein
MIWRAPQGRVGGGGGGTFREKKKEEEEEEENREMMDCLFVCVGFFGFLDVFWGERELGFGIVFSSSSFGAGIGTFGAAASFLFFFLFFGRKRKGKERNGRDNIMINVV